MSWLSYEEWAGLSTQSERELEEADLENLAEFYELEEDYPGRRTDAGCERYSVVGEDGVHDAHGGETQMNTYYMSLIATLHTAEGIKLEDVTTRISTWIDYDRVPTNDFRRLARAIADTASEPLCEDCGRFVHPGAEEQLCVRITAPSRKAFDVMAGEERIGVVLDYTADHAGGYVALHLLHPTLIEFFSTENENAFEEAIEYVRKLGDIAQKEAI